MNAPCSFLIVALTICAFLAVPATSAIQEGSDDIIFKFHKMTPDEAAERERTIGVYDSSRNYNVMVNGHGTGLAPPTKDQLTSMVGVVNVLDSIEGDFEALPGAVDLSARPTFPAVGNQSSQPSCAAWAAAYYAYGFLEAEDNDWTLASSANPEQLISPAWTYARSNGGRDLGSSMDENMMVIQDWGAATMATMPFDEFEYLDLGPAPAFREAPAHRAEDWFAISYSDASTIEEIKTLVSEGIPVTFGIDALQFSSGFSDDNYILSSVEYSSFNLNHAQTIVGYDDTVTDDEEEGAFWVVNSWGESWGDQGFYWFTYDAMRELGDIDRAFLNFISDIEDYSPTLVANWHFNDAPSRSANLEVGIGSPSSPLDIKDPFVVIDTNPSHEYPTFMCLDITEFASFYEDSSEEFFLEVGRSSERGTISSFKVEQHAGGFMPGSPTRSSPQSADVHRSTPGTVTVAFPRYDAIEADDAVDAIGADLTDASEVTWIPVEDITAMGSDSLQSGDVGDGETTSLVLSVFGPVDFMFSWKVSSETSADILSFSVPGSDIHSHVSGGIDWTEECFALGEGLHTIYWNFTKDSAMSERSDTAWIDDIHLEAPLPSFSLQESYTAEWNEPLEVSPMDIDNPSGSVLDFWYDWGDGSALTHGNPADGYSASHEYATVDDFELTVWAADEHDNNVSESALVHVVDGNAKPAVQSLAIDPSSEFYSSGDNIRIDVDVVDAEGDELTVTVRIEALEVVMSDTAASQAGVSMVFSFDYTCPQTSEAPYVVHAEVRDDAEHFSQEWDSVEIELLVNSPPVAVLGVDVSEGDTLTIFYFDASGSYDEETPVSGLMARWDWDNDGAWDTAWSESFELSYQFPLPGSYIITVEIMDGSGLTSTDSLEVEVGGEAIPEFSLMIVPAVIVLALVLLISLTRTRR